VNREVALITGGGSGVGLASARLLTARGAAVALFDRPGAGVEEAAAELGAAGAASIGIEGGIADPADLTTAVERAASTLGAITTVIAAAATDRPENLEATEDEAWRAYLDTNLSGVFLLARRTLPRLVETRGTFVAVASLAGVRSWPGQPASAATMHGIVGLVKTLGQDYGHTGVRCNVVCAAPVEGQDGTRESDGDRERLISQIPFGRLATAEEVAEVVAHLSSEDSSYTNAAVQMVDGGASVGYFAPAD
jgi:meso-butanediol dehydrogenase / (S,S)-butanediol dehydrogenase / diacetyl reductase